MRCKLLFSQADFKCIGQISLKISHFSFSSEQDIELTKKKKYVIELSMNIWTFFAAPNTFQSVINEFGLIWLFDASFGNTTWNHSCHGLWMEIRLLHLHRTRLCYDVDRHGHRLFLSHAFDPKMYHCLPTHFLLQPWFPNDANAILDYLDSGNYHCLSTTFGVEWNCTWTVRIEVMFLCSPIRVV